MELRRYQTKSGTVPFSMWLSRLDLYATSRIQAYVDRMKYGNFGDSKRLGANVSELRIDFGPGYRVYYLKDGANIVLLLLGGDKRSQKSDILKAINFAEDYWKRK